MSYTPPGSIVFPLPEVHAPDFGLYDEATERVWCIRCRRFIDADAWAKPCPMGRP